MQPQTTTTPTLTETVQVLEDAMASGLPWQPLAAEYQELTGEGRALWALAVKRALARRDAASLALLGRPEYQARADTGSPDPFAPHLVAGRSVRVRGAAKRYAYHAAGLYVAVARKRDGMLTWRLVCSVGPDRRGHGVLIADQEEAAAKYGCRATYGVASPVGQAVARGRLDGLAWASVAAAAIAEVLAE